MAVRVLVVDNYDSFVFNLVQYLGQLGVDVEVWRNDDARLMNTEAEIIDVVEQFDGVLLSPGPGTPQRAGASIALVHTCAATRTPLLGVCLGHQAIGVAYGATVDRASELLHGKTSMVFHTDDDLFRGLANPFTATRYHSLTIIADTLPPQLIATAHTDSGIIMGIRHTEFPLHGVQFHPESILTQSGHRMLANWLNYCGHTVNDSVIRQLECDIATTVSEALTTSVTPLAQGAVTPQTEA